MPIKKGSFDIATPRYLAETAKELAEELKTSRYTKVRRLSQTALRMAEVLQYAVDHNGLQLYELRNIGYRGAIASIGSMEELLERHGFDLEYKEDVTA